MSFSQLPEELVDYIAEHVEYCKYDFSSSCHTSPDSTAFIAYGPRVLSAFCHVSRQTLAPARRVLYRRPFATYLSFTWSEAVSLLYALEANDKHLGRLVRDTSSIDENLQSLTMELEEDDRFEGRATEQVWTWYKRILKACPHLQTVHIISENSYELSTLLDALALLPHTIPAIEGSETTQSPQSQLRSTIRRMTFADPWEGADAEGEVCLELLEALQLAPIVSLDYLSLYYPNWPPSLDLRHLPTRLPFDIKHIDISSYQHPLSFYFPFFPQSLTSLQSLTYFGHASLDGRDLLALPNVAGPNLHTLNFRFFKSPATFEVNLSDYSARTTFPAIPLQAFQAFPQLTSLALHDTHGPSLRLLETLAQNSPLLSLIDFLGSRWVADSDRLSNDPDKIFPETQILASLQRFKHLRSFNPGYLPSRERKRYEGFATSVSEGGVKIKYMVCEEVDWE